MLTYLGVGLRRYGERPVPVYGRPCWEIQASLSGAIAPSLPPSARGDDEPRERGLWIFPPDHEHGWTAKRGRVAEIAVFHFESIPEPAATFVRHRGFIAVILAEPALSRVRSLSEELAPLRDGRDPLALLRFDRAAVELAIIALEALPERETVALLDRAGLAVASALAWYSEHMAERPRLADVARAVNCSESHLRRLFVAARGQSPQAAFDAMRAGRARDMIRGEAISMKEIAAACGYDSPSSFSRAFARIEGRAPRELRREREAGAFRYSADPGDMSNEAT